MPKRPYPKGCLVSGTEYSRVYRRIDYYLPKALANVDGLLTIEEIRKLLADEVGVYFHPETIRKYNQRYAKRYGMGPLCQFGDRYKLNHCLYELKEIKPPRKRKKV